MMKTTEFTKNQKEAIFSDKKDIVISAGAGSGKTTVLTERIFTLLTSEENQVDIGNMLVVTFTKSSAADLKKKIYDKLVSAIAENPGDSALKTQLVKLSSAKISTIHSFLYDVIKTNHVTLGLDNDIRLIDENEIAQISYDVLESVIEDCYTNLEDFDYLVSTFVFNNDKNLVEKLLSTFNGFNNKDVLPDSVFENINLLETIEYENYFDSSYGRYFYDDFKRFLLSYKDKFSALLERYKDEPDFDKISVKIECEIDRIERLLNGLENGYDYLWSNLDSFFAKTPNFGRGHDKDHPVVKYYKCYKSKLEDDYQDKIIDKESFDYQKTSLIRSLRLLHRVYEKYLSQLEKEKRRLSVIEFSDLERLAVKLFEENDDVISELASKYKYVFVDEYQDVNDSQQIIFEKFRKHGSSLFRVGDIKQSIYGFRGAVPDNFNSLKNKYHTDDSDDYGESIFLSDNFRCGKKIVDFCNNISSGTLVDGVIDSSYDTENEKLICNIDEAKVNSSVDVIIVDRENKEYSEGKKIVDIIKELTDSGYSKNDIAILSRSNSTKQKIKKILKENNIQCSDSTELGFFESPEIQTIFAILNVIDNSSKDIYTAAAIMSPIFKATLDDIEKLNAQFKGESYTLYDKIQKSDSPVFVNFYSKIEDYRNFEMGKNSSDLINYIYRDCKIREIFGKDSIARLDAFRDLSTAYESNSFKGLYRFIKYIEKIKDNNTDDIIKIPSEKSGVNLMTIHGSKGLEYKVVILANTLKPMKPVEISHAIIYSKQTGIAMKIPDGTGYGRYTTVFYSSVKRAIENLYFEEEYRLLYVAMTRAKEKMIFTAMPQGRSGGGFDPSYISQLFRIIKADYFDYQTYNNYLSSLLISLAKNYAYNDYNIVNFSYTLTNPENAESNESKTDNESNNNEIKCEDIDFDSLRKVLNYKYPHRIAYHNVPVKLSVSRIYPAILDKLEEDETASFSEKDFRAPSFISSDDNNAAFKGTATHAFMQFCNMANLYSEGLEFEIERIKNNKILSDEMIDAIDFKDIEKLIGNDFFKKISLSDKLKREVSFTINMPAPLFTESEDYSSELDGEFVLTQGVIDCIVSDQNGKNTILDYKTDKKPDNKGKEEFKKILLDRHHVQLDIYKYAVNKMYNRKDTVAYIYSFALGEFIEVK